MTDFVSREPTQATIEQQAKERVLASLKTQLSDHDIAEIELIVRSIAEQQKL